jgi:mannitol/fructose-specific phosphotransferase system IIA component (Ntr-type)
MKLASLLNHNYIFLNLKGDDRESAYSELVNRMFEVKPLPVSKEVIVKEMIEREDATQIAYEKKFAFPHIRLNELDDLHIAIGITEKPIRLKDNDISETEIIIAFFISKNTSQIYLMALSAITKFLLKKDGVEKIINSRTPEDLISVLKNENIEIKHTITAEDIMEKTYPFVHENDHISKVLDIFTSERRIKLPVIGKNKNLLGVIDALTLVRNNIPKYMMLLDNYKFLTSFEPFDKLIKEEKKVLAYEIMNKPEMIIAPETPLIQLTLTLVKENVSCLFVVKDNILVGIVTMQEIISRVLRG